MHGIEGEQVGDDVVERTVKRDTPGCKLSRDTSVYPTFTPLCQGKRGGGGKGCGQEHTYPQLIATATAMNIIRLMRWLNSKPLAKTIPSP
jgi:hypothetical protein